MKKSRFTQPVYRFLALDDVSYELLTARKKMRRSDSSVCVVIAAKELQDVMVRHDGMKVIMGFITAQVVWSGNGKSAKAAEIRAATIHQKDEDADDIGLAFIEDLQDFFDLYEEKSLEEVMTENFAEL